ncbi:Sec63 complex subunit SEC66 [Aspergillus puulaauensis]|uniref:Translocation protein S66 n=1 Tax=Aspergillus puulaauensis TaxID=1220207 RepID=A0A7R7XHQ4_9EURO|nr:translocation protein S66 [Aspergillus puulaauensis]BCS21358.1 translocation protein S66 [Aspergillus puulaauensis]
MVDWVTLVVPFAYLSVLIGSLATFSSLYRKRKARNATSLEPWFPPHLQRDIYFSLLHLEPSASASKEKEKEKKIPESVLKAALLRRACEDIKRVMALRSQKQALSMLLQRGSVGDDLWQRFLRAEKEMEDEVRDVVNEANAYSPNWGQTIFQSANEMVNNAIVRERLEKHQNKLDEEKAWWGKRKATIQEGFMKELDAEKRVTASATTTTAAAAATDVVEEKKTAASAAAPPAPTVTESDEDAVLVEADDQAGATAQRSPGGGGSGGGKKKKKGKK